MQQTFQNINNMTEYLQNCNISSGKMQEEIHIIFKMQERLQNAAKCLAIPWDAFIEFLRNYI